MIKAVARKPENSNFQKSVLQAVDPIQRGSNSPRESDLPESRDEIYDGSDENDDVINGLIGDRGGLEADEALNDGNSAYSDQPSNGPHVKNWPSTE